MKPRGGLEANFDGGGGNQIFLVFMVVPFVEFIVDVLNDSVCFYNSAALRLQAVIFLNRCRTANQSPESELEKRVGIIVIWEVTPLKGILWTIFTDGVTFNLKSNFRLEIYS